MRPEIKAERRRDVRSLASCAITACAVLILGCSCAARRSVRFDVIEVRGTPEFQKQITNALLLLRSKAPAGYQTVTNDIGIIREAKRSGMRAWTKPPIFDFSMRSASYSLTWCASAIAHDSMHSRLYHDFLSKNPRRSVPASVWCGEAVELQCSDHQARILRDLDAPIHEINWCAHTNKYWEIKYRDRTW